MGLVNDRELASLLDADRRHVPLRIEERGVNGNFRSHCSCGYASTRRRTPQLAAEALIHHMRKVGRELVANGGLANSGAPLRNGADIR